MVDELSLNARMVRAKLKVNLKLLNDAVSRIPRRKVAIHKAWTFAYGLMFLLVIGMHLWAFLMIYILNIRQFIFQLIGH